MGTMLLLSSSFLQASEEAQEVVSTWMTAAESVSNLQLHIRGTDIRPPEDSPGFRLPNPPNSAEMTLVFDIEYLWKRPNWERYSRRGNMPSSKGMRQFNQHRVLFKDEVRELIEGGEDSHMPHDQYKFQQARPVRAIELQPIRNLFNLNYTASGPFFDAHTFELVPQGEQTIDGNECLLAESSKEQGARIWFETAKPHRIHKMELMHLVANRAGHMEYKFKYKSNPAHAPAQKAPVTPFDDLAGWEIAVFSANGRYRSQIDCRVVSVTINKDVPDSAFELPIPPGALITDYRTKEREYSLQLATGSTRPIPQDQINPQLVLQLSASVPGSRVANRGAAQPLETKRFPLFRPLIIGNLIFAGVLIAVHVRKRNAHHVK